MARIELTEEKISRLRFINKQGLKPGRYEFPDFLLIGPQRTGTTWLHANLCSHPEIFMAPEKELYFFSNLITKEGAHYTSDRLEWYSSKFEQSLSNFFLQNVLSFRKEKSFQSLDFNFRKFSSSYVKGEATASYAAMPEVLINEIFVLNENIKAIMLIRHPFERAWSHAKKMVIKRNKTIEEVSFEEFRKFYAEDYQLRCGRYTEIIEKWSRFLPEDRFFIGNFDDIKNEPDNLLKRIHAFLEVSTEKGNIDHHLTQRVINPTAAERIPDEHIQLLSELFHDEVSELKQRFNFNWH